MNLREHVTLAELRTGVADKVVVIDPGWEIAPDVCHAVAARVEGRLSALGTQVLLTRGPGSEGKPERDRADFANEVAAHLVVSINADQVSGVQPNGTATFYYGDPRGGTHSPGGRVLADLVQFEVTRRTGMLDCRTHPRNWDLLRLTRMPAVRIELGYLSNPQDAGMLHDVRQQDAMGEAIAEAITRFCSPR
jgi:N-acetylmuramoyl-L-alanine amidase